MTKTPIKPQHLPVLRKHVLYCVIGVLVSIVALTPWMDACYKLLTHTLKTNNTFYLVAIKPLSPITTMLQAVLFIAFALNIPHIFFQIWRFIQPSLYTKEKKTAGKLLLLGLFLFYAGGLFSYFVTTPILIHFNQWVLPENILFTLDISAYLSLMLTSMLIFGLFFLLPIFMNMMVRFGLLNRKQFQKNRKYFVLICFVLSMLITPPDIFSQTLMALPLIGLYELGILISPKATH